MQTFIDRYIEQGWEQGIEHGKQQGEAAVLLRLILLKFWQRSILLVPYFAKPGPIVSTSKPTRVRCSRLNSMPIRWIGCPVARYGSA
jgi:hypothetical protein